MPEVGRDQVEVQVPAPAPDLRGPSIAPAPFTSNGAVARTIARPGHGAPPESLRAIAVQRASGNAAAARMVARWQAHEPAARWLSRYEAGEHAQFGGSRAISIRGVNLTEGEIIALAGDLFRDPNSLLSASAEELTALRDLVRRDKDHYEGKPGVAAVSNDEWQHATLGRPAGQRYMDLAKVNDTHFARPASGKPGPHGDNQSEWEKWHREALRRTKAAADAGKPGVPPDAILYNAFAAHFLTDAFSAGHIVNKDDGMARARKEWDTQKFSGWIFKESRFTKAVAAGILRHREAGPKLAKTELKIIIWDDVTPTRFSEFIYQMAARKPELFFNAFARLIHDELNRSIKDPRGGLEVTNGHGDIWRLAGDETLSFSKDTLRIATKAVEESHQNLETVARAPQLDWTKLIKWVWDYTPEPTVSGSAFLESLIKTYTDPKNPKTVTAFVSLAAEQIDTLIGQLKEQGYMRDKKR
jgi:hypothetical protein